MNIYDHRLSLIIHRCNDQTSIDQAICYHQTHQEIMMECDVRLTADNVHVAWHNYYFQQKKISKIPYADLGGRVLTIEHILWQAAPQSLKLHLDVKVRKQNNTWLAAADADLLFALLEKTRMTDKVIISNIKGRFLRKLRELSPEINLGILYDEDYGYLRPTSKNEVHNFIGHILDTHQQINVTTIFFNQYWLQVLDKSFNMLDKVFYTLVKAGLKVAVWTVNQPQTAKLFAQRGAHWLTTDKPETLHAMLINPSVQDVKQML